ncbi:uncharacterized protein LOC115676395 isoform X1 [Syzygium oleosum]|uniref:uncharacterized protein LOC115676395 isoform X1 n=2 Tax=Syzygium oleosum TaxID=219896 RepID=UPI0024BA0702|nr:uncharacterized protein LOC115676395 isoform X1 [Syzygium oleosum]
MFRRIGWFIGLNNHSYSAKRLPDAKPRPAKVKPVAIMDTTQEIAIYIHRFHNLDLFQQGWYQIKITMKWEDSQHGIPGTPARVVQYEVPDLGSDDIHGIWRINDTDNSFSTQPFRIKYARQDVLLSIMVSFNLPLGKFEGPSTSAVVLKFELMYAPISESGSGLQASLDSCAAAVHEFRIPPKALLGLHSYCPVHFDAFHAVLVDTTVHISLLRSGSGVSPPKVNRDSRNVEELSGENIRGLGQAVGRLSSFDDRQLTVLRGLLAARDLLVEELQNLSKAIDRPIDLTDVTAVDDKTLTDLRAELGIADVKVLGPDKLQNGIEKANQNVDTRMGGLLHSSSREDLFHSFHLLGNQALYLWNTFLKFHRANKTSIMEYLRDAWATDRRAEWSIWMVYTKVEMPLHYIHSGADEPTHRRVSSLWKLADDPAQSAAMRADLHRRSIAQMRINSRSIQDMHIFGEPSHIPIVIVERVVNAPRRTVSVNSYFNHMNLKDYPGLLGGPSYEAAKKPSTQQNGRILKAVVFVHGFQGHHLDLRLVRNQWLLIDPKIEFLMSEVNEDKTSGDFKEMGQRLAQEVISFLKKKMDKISRSGSLRNIKLSFVGHSIGNIIIRTALTEGIMEPYLRYLYTYISISGPHLGYLYSSNSLFNSGLWLLKKLKGTQCIHQLTFTDDVDLQNTFLYKLCKQKTLESFRHIILLSSPQDGYVPYHSARIELCQASSSDYSKKGKIFLEMLNDCLDQIRAPSSEHRVFMRCDVNFDTSSQGRTLNTLIGRAAHIEFLETDAFARFVMWSFPELFR